MVRPPSKFPAPEKARKNQENLANNDQEISQLMEQLELIFDREHLISRQELKNPEKSPRLFAINGVVSTLISRATLISLSDAQAQIFSIAQHHFCDVRLHPLFATTTAFAAAVESFLFLFDARLFDQNTGKHLVFTVRDIFSPNARRVLNLLWALVSVVSCTSSYETAIQEKFQKIKADQEHYSSLWEEEVTVKALETDQDQKEVNEASEREIARERLAQREKEESQLDAKLIALRETSEKIFKMRDEKKESKLREEKRQLLAKVATLEDLCVSDQAQQSLSLRMTSTRQTKTQSDNELKDHDERRRKLMKENDLLDFGVGVAKTIHEKYMMSRKQDYPKLTKADRELRDMARVLSHIQDEVSNAQTGYDIKMSKLKSLTMTVREKEEEIKSNNANQRKLQGELERHIKELESKQKTLASREEQLNGRSAVLQTALEKIVSEREQILADYQRHTDLLKSECLAECDSARARKVIAVGKIAELRKYFENETGRSLDGPVAFNSEHIRDYLPLEARTVYVKANELIKQSRSTSRGRTRRNEHEQHKPAESVLTDREKSHVDDDNAASM